MFMALFALLLVQINFGILPIAQKLALTSLTPIALLSVRSVAGALAFQIALFFWRRQHRQDPLEAPTPARVYLRLSLLGISLNQFLLILALTMTTAVATVIVVPSITLFTYFFAILLKKERFTWSKAGVLSLGGTGVLILFGDSLIHLLHGLDSSAFLGNFLCLLSAAVYGYYLVRSRDYIGRQPALVFTGTMFSWALVWTGLLLLISTVTFALLHPGESFINLFLHTPALIPPTWTAAPTSDAVIYTLFFIVAGPTVTNYFLNLWSLKFLPASTVSGFISLQTLIGATLSHIFLGEEIKPSYTLAAACILLSVIWLSVTSLRRPLQGAVAKA